MAKYTPRWTLGGRRLAWGAQMRRLVFRLHMWVGIASGLYIVVVCLTGAALRGGGCGFLLGLAPALLFLSGVTMWWARVMRPRSSS